jgi:hypothetical protein
MLRRLTVLLFAISAAYACGPDEECDVEACEAAAQAQPSGEVETGLVGVAAYKTDSCTGAGPCCPCRYSQGTLLVFETDDALEPHTDKMQRFGDVEPTFTIRVEERYALTLEPRRYVVCDVALEACANLELDEGEVFTVNLQRVFGPPRLQVFDDAGQRREELEVD